ncbi:unnamed protein product, partial [marine sediment metagenome]
MDMDTGQVILSQGLPKTGQETEYREGDDGTYEFGWWKNRLNANNKTRFIAKTIGVHAVVIDLATGLMWPADGDDFGLKYRQQLRKQTGLKSYHNRQMSA